MTMHRLHPRLPRPLLLPWAVDLPLPLLLPRVAPLLPLLLLPLVVDLPLLPLLLLEAEAEADRPVPGLQPVDVGTCWPLSRAGKSSKRLTVPRVPTSRRR